MLILSLLALVGALTLRTLLSALQALGKVWAEELCTRKASSFLLWRRFVRAGRWETLLETIHLGEWLLGLFFVGLALAGNAPRLIKLSIASHLSFLGGFGLLLGLLLFLSALTGRLGRLYASHLLPLAAGLALPYLFLLTPLLLLWVVFVARVRPMKSIEPAAPTPQQLRLRLSELLHEGEMAGQVDPKLIGGLLSFQGRIAREVMVPRINVFSLPGETPLRGALHLFSQEGYSRIPVYEETVDQIIGVVLYKDLLNVLARKVDEGDLPASLEIPIRNLLKPVLYAPETKKISHLLQEFRHKQAHLAIVVDEYGGTEGIVTIEDILEELVGNIEDEFDIDEEKLFLPMPGGEWIVDAKMGILDIEKELGLHLPENPEYDTIGGYVFHKAGAIPMKGWTIHQENFELEVLSSTDRAIEKIRITPRS